MLCATLGKYPVPLTEEKHTMARVTYVKSAKGLGETP
jgi:hypothetical protein